ncbi:hypothetical protein Bca52824_083380 [Brassica carinata]|uniref:Protein BIG GRAIN 1-like E n=1 Tax=Brassica carinata TaxID=52824 RepID=A0A8X7TTJ5_BRACI|nr:hypothetical protein Bca52824_083380 [Brassica carinata]
MGDIRRRRRISLDLPIRCSEQVHNLYHDHPVKQEVTTTTERTGNVRHKKPSSPGGKLTGFLKSLFNQEGSKKSKPKSKATDGEVEEEIPEGGWITRRRRRSSISHFLSSSKSTSTTTTTSSKSSGFRTPPPYLDTPTKNYNQFLNFTSATKQVEELEEKKINKELSWLHEKLKVMDSLTLTEKKKVWADHDDDDRIIKRNRRDDDDDDDDDDDGGGGMESDSSSDLFELQNYELSRGGLPVYETTSVANINNIYKLSL